MIMPINPKLLEILCCPRTKIPMVILEKDALSNLNKKVTEGKVIYNDGTAVDSEISEALITKNNELVYAIEDGIPIMIEEKSISADFIDADLL